MDQKRFENLLQRYIDGECTEEEELRVQQWFKQIENNNSADLSHEEKSSIEQRLLRKIETRISGAEFIFTSKRPISTRTQSIYYLYAGAAAAATFLLIIFAFLNQEKTIDLNTSEKSAAVANGNGGLVSHKNQTKANQLIRLPDKSSVQLAPGSSISYLGQFELSRREVHLHGDAFFDVSRNPNRPFIVYCGRTVTRVLGTSFWIKSLSESKSIEVSVKTGKVSVSEAVDGVMDRLPEKRTYGNTILLKPNQRVIFFGPKQKVETMLVETPLLLDSLEIEPEKFVYTDSPVSQVIEDLSTGYGVEIITPIETLKKCSFTGDLTEMNFDEKFEIVCSSIGASYKKRGLQIILVGGDGCK